MSTNVELYPEGGTPHMVRSPKTQKNPNVPGKISEKNRKKMLDKGGGVWYISQARLRETAER